MTPPPRPGASAPARLPTGSRLGGAYTVLAMVGEDAVSVRYQVRNEHLGNTCLARVFTAPACCEDEAVREAVRAAALAQSRITHGNVLVVRDVFARDDATLVVVTDFIDGPSLAAWLGSRGPLDEDEAADIVRQILSALIACHRKGLLHLGLRPECLTLAPDGEAVRVVIDDFGTARILGHADARYRSPEQERRAEPDARSDLYAVGLLFYELLTGELPADERGAAGLRTLLPTLPLTVERVILRALARSPEERFANARAMRVALSSDAAILPAVKPLSSASMRLSAEALEPAPAPGRASRRGIAVAALLLAVVAAGWAVYRLALGTDAAPEAGDDDGLDLASSLLGLDARQRAEDATRRPRLPAIRPDAPVPVDALPSLGAAPALVELVFVTDLELAFRAPLLSTSLVEPLRVRYGDNLRISWLVLPERSRAHALERARAALAAHLQGAFHLYAEALVRQPRLAGRAELTTLAESLGLDARRFADDLADTWLDELVAHHESLAQQLHSARPGAVFVNGRPLSFAPTAPRVVSLDALTATIDAELDAVQRVLAEGIAPEAVAARRTVENLATTPDGAEADALAPFDSPRRSSSADGLPGLGASNAPLSLVLYVDLERPEGRTTLEQLVAFYERHPESVRLTVKLAPLPDNQAGFELAMQLMGEHAAGRFWRALDHVASDPAPAGRGDEQLPRQAELLRSRLLDYSREAAALSGAGEGWPLVLANGRVLASSPGRLERGLEEERRLVELLVASGVSRDAVHELVSTSSEPIALPAPPSPSRFLVANWQALPRSGPVDAPVIVFWRFSLLEPHWPATLVALRALRATMGDEVAVVLAPAPPSDAASADPTLRLFEAWWNGDDQGSAGRLDAELAGLLARLESEPALREDPAALVEAVLPQPRSATVPRDDEPAEAPRDEDTDDHDDDHDRDASDAAAEHDGEGEPGEAAVADARREAARSRRRVVESHAMQWAAEDAAPGTVMVAWRRGLSFVGWTLPGGLAFEPYWDAVRRAQQRQ